MLQDESDVWGSAMGSAAFPGAGLADSDYGGALTAFFDHGILVVEDVETPGRHEDWDSDTEPFHLDVDSLYVAVLASVDGPVRVDVFHCGPPAEFTDGLVLKLEGVLETPSARVVVQDLDDHAELRVGVFSRAQDLKVFVNDSKWVDRVVIVLTAR
ncbi:hypothetical protein QRX50_39045 [Amycolatopsis carbonis]|uniref:Uncharacterized protein n=1 Tax=Amycolatopsis carbonis TaxID=715471 RepID=A0A9Y2IBG7_9PSEU|nr:hypothetical protein [Amycolatopsis sp. 2-15]WIX77345.1 hypothetical protein QRX50_39045 [Amycolatopsis sp. 2-15]